MVEEVTTATPTEHDRKYRPERPRRRRRRI
jgi:hypothetical protein